MFGDGLVERLAPVHPHLVQLVFGGHRPAGQFVVAQASELGLQIVAAVAHRRAGSCCCSTVSSICMTNRCWALGRALTRLSCCWSLDAGPRFPAPRWVDVIRESEAKR